MIDRVHRELTDEDIRKIADTYHSWRGDALGTPSPSSARGKKADVGVGAPREYEDIPGFCKSATLDDIRHHNHILTPGRYVGAAKIEDDGEPFEEKMARLTAELKKQMTEGAELDRQIWKNLEGLGYGN